MNHRLGIRPNHVLVALTALAVATLAGCSSTSGGDQPGNEGGVTTPAATSAATASAEETTSAQVVPLGLNADGLLGGNATVTDFDAGEQGVVSTVDVGQFDAGSGTLPFVFRNNTSEAVSHVNASATVRDAGGALTATGSSQGTVPAQIPPGGLGLAYIFLEQGEVPDGATFEYTFDTSPADTSSYNTGDLQVTEASATDDGVIGTATNQTDATLTGPYSADVYCFDESGTLLSHTRGFANEMNDVPPAGTVSFSTSFYGDECPTFLTGVTGYFS